MVNVVKNELMGVGLYSVPEASRLSGVANQRIRRWLAGYSYIVEGESRFKEGLWKPQIEDVDHTLTIGFLDLMEIRFVNRFVQAGVSLHTIRRAFKYAQELLGKQHPFSTRRFQTDGRTIFAEVAHDSGEIHLLDLIKSQFAFTSVISPSLYRDLDYSEDDDVLRWWPMGHKRKVIIDPQLSFGQPIVPDDAVPTATLASAVKAEGSVSAVAEWFEVSIKAVKDAVEFEEHLAA
jgi:uncharacterized protein (DUF433 family)